MTEALEPLQDGEENADAFDYLYGADNIAAFLKVNVRKIYRFMELKKTGKCTAPVQKKQGLGIYASKKALLEYMNTGR